MALFRVKIAIKDHNPGDVKTAEELKGCDINWLLLQGCIEPVSGPTGEIDLASATTDDLLNEVGELQRKWEEADKDNEYQKARVAQLESENAELKAANVKALDETRRTLDKLHEVNSRLAILKRCTAPPPEPAPEPVTV